MSKAYPDPSTVSSLPGRVEVEGPDHVEVAFTPSAAAETGARLLEAAAKAEGERLLEEEMESRKDRPSDQLPA